MKKITIACAALALVVFSTNCGGSKTADFAYEIKDMEFVFEPPYVGSDTKSAEVNLNLDSAFTANKADITKIEKVTLDNVSFDMESGKNFDNLSGLTVEFQSDDEAVKTITVGSMNEVAKGKTNVSFAGSEKQNADAFFNKRKFNVMLSSNMKAEDTIPYKIKGTLKFKVKAGSK